MSSFKSPGQLLREQLTKYGVSTAELAKRIGVSEALIRKIISDERSLTFTLCEKLGAAFESGGVYWFCTQVRFDEFDFDITPFQKPSRSRRHAPHSSEIPTASKLAAKSGKRPAKRPVQSGSKRKR